MVRPVLVLFCLFAITVGTILGVPWVEAGVPNTDLYGRMNGNVIRYRFADKAACDSQLTSWAPVMESKTSATTRAITKWSTLLPVVTWQEVQTSENLIIYCETSGTVSETDYLSTHEQNGVTIFDYVAVHFASMGGVVIIEHELGHVLGLPDNPVECQSDYKYLMCSVNANGTPDIGLALARASQDLLDPSQRQLAELNAAYGSSPPPPEGLFFVKDMGGNEIQVAQGGSVRVFPPVSLEVKTQSSTLNWQVLIDGAPYTMTQSSGSVFSTTPIPLSVGTHNVRFEYQTTGSSWTPLAILTLEGANSTQAQPYLTTIGLGVFVVATVIVGILLIRRRRH